jgi:hypothetical protein
MLGEAFDLVDGFRGIGVSDKLGVQVAWMIRRLEREAEVIHGEDVFQEFRFLEVSNPTGLATGIELMRQCIRAGVEVVIVSGLIDSHPPKNDGGMIPVAADHTANVVNGNILPGLITDMLPAGDLFQHEKAHFVASVKKMARLGIVRSANDVALEFVTQDIGVPALHATGHRLTDPGKGLVAIQPSQLDDLAVELEAMIGELGLAEAEAARIFVEQLRSVAEAHARGIQLVVLEIPQSDSVEMVEPQCMWQRFGGRGRRRNLL